MDKNIIIVITAALILVGIVAAVIRANKRKKEYDTKLSTGVKTTGLIYAVKPQSFQSNKKYPISVKLSYEAVGAIAHGNVITQVSRVAPNLHPYIAEPVGISSLGLGGVKIIAQRHQQMKEYRQKLKDEGKTAEEINKAVMDVAWKMSHAKPGGIQGEQDKDGYLVLENPVKVDVYVNGDDTTIVFKPELLDEYFDSQKFFE